MNTLRVLFLCCLGLFIAATSALSAESVKVAAIFARSGIAAAHNAPLISLLELAASEINLKGGILGRMLELILLDNQSTTIGSTLAAEQAAQLDVVAVIGAHWSSHSLAMAPILQKKGIPMITPASTNPEITKAGDYIFRICFLDSFQGAAMARFARQSLQAKRSAVLRNLDETYSMALADFFKDAFIQSGGEVVLDRGYRGKAVDFSAIIDELKTLRPDSVFLPGYTRDSGLIVKQSASRDLKTVFLGGDAWDEIHGIAGAALAGSYQAAPWHPQVPFARSVHLQRVYRSKYGRDIENMSAPLAYDALMLLADAVERGGSLERSRVRDALAETTAFEGATGWISFDQNRNPENKDIIILRHDADGPKYFTTLRF